MRLNSISINPYSAQRNNNQCRINMKAKIPSDSFRTFSKELIEKFLNCSDIPKEMTIENADLPVLLNHILGKERYSTKITELLGSLDIPDNSRIQAKNKIFPEILEAAQRSIYKQLDNKYVLLVPKKAALRTQIPLDNSIQLEPMSENEFLKLFEKLETKLSAL